MSHSKAILCVIFFSVCSPPKTSDQVYCYLSVTFEPPRDKTNKVSVRPAKTQISLGIRPVWSESLLSAWRKLGPLATHWVHSEDWSDWADAQADLSLRWVHSHIAGFVTRRLICKINFGLINLDTEMSPYATLLMEASAWPSS